MMDIFFKLFLTIHIACGALGLLSGVINMLSKKGDKRHKIIGKIFSVSMLTTGLTSLILSAIHPSFFMFMVGIFTVYMVGTGVRYLNFKKLNNEQKPKFIDWFFSIIMLLTGLFFIGLGSLNIFKSNFFGLVFITFGFIGLNFVRQDYRNYKGQSNVENFWLSEHLQRMIGGFIASSTAFLVLNAKHFPGSIPITFYWLLPTAILTPLIIKWVRKYEVKKK